MSKKDFWNAPVPEVPGLSFCDRFTWERVLAGVKLSASVRAVALTLVQYASAKTGDNIFPGNARLAAASGAGARTVERALALLRDSHLLIQTRRGTNMSGPSSGEARPSVHRLCAPTLLVEMIADGWDVDAEHKFRVLDFASMEPAALLSPCACHPSNLADSTTDLPVQSGGEVADLAAKSDKLPAISNKLPAKSDDLPVSDGDLSTTSSTTSDQSSSSTKQLPASLTRVPETEESDPWEQQEPHPAGSGLGLMNEEDPEESSGSAADVPPDVTELLRSKGYPDWIHADTWADAMAEEWHDTSKALALIDCLPTQDPSLPPF